MGDPDIAPEYDFRDATSNPYAGRYRADHAPIITAAESVTHDDDAAPGGSPMKVRGCHGSVRSESIAIEFEPPAKRAGAPRTPGPAADGRKE